MIFLKNVFTHSYSGVKVINHNCLLQGQDPSLNLRESCTMMEGVNYNKTSQMLTRLEQTKSNLWFFNAFVHYSSLKIDSYYDDGLFIEI